MKFPHAFSPVSYTHLDVYKRQGLSWLCYYRALQTGQASLVAPIDKLSILFTVAFSWLFLKEKLTWKSAAGLVLIVAGTLLLLVF